MSLGENRTPLRTWHWNNSLDPVFCCSVLSFSLSSFMCPGDETVDPHLPKPSPNQRWKIWGLALAEDQGDHKARIRLQPNLPACAGVLCTVFLVFSSSWSKDHFCTAFFVELSIIYVPKVPICQVNSGQNYTVLCTVLYLSADLN